MNWSSHTVLLTGANGGIGQAIARQLAEKGCQLILVGRNAATLQVLQDSLPGKHFSIIADIATSDGLDTLFSGLAPLPKVTMLINNAGVNTFGQLTDMNPENIDNTLAINLHTPITLTMRLLPVIQSARQGVIVNVGSVLGSIGFPCQSVYCASKFGLKGFTESLSRELAGTSTSVFYLAPRATNTTINSKSIMAMNSELGTHSDSPQTVAAALIQQLQSNRLRKTVGFPESLFVAINGAFPNIVDKSFIKQLPIIRRFAKQHVQEVIV